MRSSYLIEFGVVLIRAMIKFVFLFIILVSGASVAHAAGTVIVRGGYRDGFVLTGNVDCMQAFNEFWEKTGANEIGLKSPDIFVNAVGLTMCRFDGTNTHFELLAKFLPITAKGEAQLSEMIRRRSGADFYGNPINFETPTHFIVETKFAINGDDPKQLRKVELVPNESEYALGASFSNTVQDVMQSPESLKKFEALIGAEFGIKDEAFLKALKSARFLSVRKSMIYIFDSKFTDRSLDWWWQFWGKDLQCANDPCPR